jgi:hypothetical protein
MTNKFDFNKIKNEIDREKHNRISTPSQFGESVGSGQSPRDAFLNGLLTARHSGVETSSTQLIKVVENKVANKKGGASVHNINETVPQHNQRPTQRPNRPTPIDMSEDREEMMYQQFNGKKSNQTLAESIETFNGGSRNPNSNINHNNQQYLTSLPNNVQQYPTQINESVLNESVRNMVNGYLTENLGSVFEEAIKNTIIEMYAVERINEVLRENKDLIKSVVVETIREIQARKSKAQ